MPKCTCKLPYTVNHTHFPCGAVADYIELPGGKFILKFRGKVIACMPVTTFLQYFSKNRK